MNKIILRPAIPAHMNHIRRFHREQNERDGTSYPLPVFFDKHGLLTQQVPVALVGVDESTEDPIQAIWVERRAELMFAGCDPKATAFARRDIDGLAAVLLLSVCRSNLRPQLPDADYRLHRRGDGQEEGIEWLTAPVFHAPTAAGLGASG